jgi:lysine 2,3-aminomutase
MGSIMAEQIYTKRGPVKQNYSTHSSAWKDELHGRIDSGEALLEAIPWLPKSPLFERLYGSRHAFLETCASLESGFRFAVTPYYLSLADREHPACPILLQILPQPQELTDSRFTHPDPLAEEEHQAAPGLTHRYPDRVLWYLSHNCAVYCRFCMRKRKVSRADSAPSAAHRLQALAYIRSNTQIKEVILSGGDPLSLSDHAIDEILSQLRQIPHLSSIRIHSRMPVTLPARLTDDFARMLSRHYPVTLVTHFNHAVEVTAKAVSAVKTLRMNGVLVLNQAVLLKDVNDSVAEQEKLLLSLLRAGVKPYYLHQCDEVQGVSHFRASVETGLAIMAGLQGRNPGIAIPRYVLDLPGGGGKIPLENDYRADCSAVGQTYRNFAGKTFQTSATSSEKSE